jgi:general secretion pathway protein C
MFRSGQVISRDGIAFMRGLVLGLGFSLTLVGMGEEGVRNASEAATNTTAGRKPPAAVSLALRGTILSASSAEARAIIVDGSGHELVYGHGDEISLGESVVEIHRNYVVLRRNGRLEKIDFFRKSAEPLLDRPAGMEPGNMPAENDPEALRTVMFTHPELLLQLVGATVALEDGRFFGYRVMAPQDPAFLESLGLKPGDILTAVNGAPLNTPDYGAGVFKALSGTGRLMFTFCRGNQILVLDH